MRDSSVKGSKLHDPNNVIDKIVEDAVNPKKTPGDVNVERFIEVFERSARRWEMVVYPAMFAFILLAGYGFYLVYSLTNDMRQIAANMDPQMGLHMAGFSVHLESMAGNVEIMADRVQDMSADLGTMTAQMDHLSQMEPMAQNINTMAHSVQGMTVNMDMMRRDFGILNHNVSRPMSFMNSFMPW